jgi:hypothetical protein
MENSDKLIRLDLQDNILIARCEIMKGERISISGEEIEMKETVNLGFKLASKKIITGEKIIKYGTPIGSATTEIPLGEIVHVHNIKSDYSPTYTIQNQSEYEGR